jgi:hypothetical protein
MHCCIHQHVFNQTIHNLVSEHQPGAQWAKSHGSAKIMHMQLITNSACPDVCMRVAIHTLMQAYITEQRCIARCCGPPQCACRHAQAHYWLSIIHTCRKAMNLQ